MNRLKLASRWILAATLTAGIFVPGCAADSVDADENTQDLSAPEAQEVLQFRNDFYTYLKKDGNYTDERIRQLVLMPTDAALRPNVIPNAKDPLKPYDEAFKKLYPKDFYQQGLVTPLTKVTGADGSIESQLRKNPVHIVIVPGIFGEFIPVSPFEEVFRYGGAASVEWDRKLKALEADPANDSFTKDKQYSAAALKDVTRSLRDVMRVGSIDDADGTPLITVTYLKPEVGSLETFGTLDENANYYLPRLEKYFKVIGVPEHLYLMGYSRGAATALNLITRAEESRANWMPKLRGMISLAGVIYGSQLADAATSPGPQKDLLDATVDFIQNGLESCEPEADSPGALRVTRNAAKWTQYLAKAAYLSTKLGNQNEALSREGLDTAMADAGRFVSFARRVLFARPGDVMSDTTDVSLASGVLNLGAPNKEYCQNVDRLKVTLQQLVKGIDTLTTRARTTWWKTHTVPTSVQYYAITGTMGDATLKGERVSPLAVNDTAYDVRSVDFRSLRGNYYDLLNASGTQLQDSQVPVQRGRFWPEIHSAFNPAQKPLKTHFMGTLGIHHWGLSFPRAFSTRDGLTANPFPRTLLLKAIGSFVAQAERGS